MTEPTRTESTRIAMLEQSYIYFGQQQQAMGQKLDRLYEAVFGGDSNDDSMRSQIKSLSKQIETLTQTIANSQTRGEEVGKAGFSRIEALEKQVEQFERWQKAQESVTLDKHTLVRQYAFMIISALTSSTIGIVVGWFLGRMLH